MPIITIDEIKNRRDRHNQNNITRTTYYLEYYFRHPEVPWTLLAAGTSRNAGYQMSDLPRFQRYAARIDGSQGADDRTAAVERLACLADLALVPACGIALIANRRSTSTASSLFTTLRRRSAK
jgi:hypothetical protein